ncbi:hypothetical protein [Geodermatophilus maliterrae]|uniref:Uncharacterized protein n=1 Tax=Geodermatophilus maliterrae TaxID=3162531 RepID=A0ABV3XBZ1_9ACTN
MSTGYPGALTGIPPARGSGPAPGHGRDTTIGAERPSLPEWRARGW